MAGGREGYRRSDHERRDAERKVTEPLIKRYFDTGILELPDAKFIDALIQDIRRRESAAHGHHEPEAKVGRLKWDLLAALIGVAPVSDPKLSWIEQRELPLEVELGFQYAEASAQILYTYELATFIHEPEKLPFSSVHILTDRVCTAGLSTMRSQLKEPRSQADIMLDAQHRKMTRALGYIAVFTMNHPTIPTIEQYEQEIHSPH